MLILKYILIDMTSTWKEMRRTMSIKKKSKNTKISRYLKGVRLTELATCNIELMEEEQGPSKNVFKNHKVLQRKVFGNHNE
jgi:hypothetical protein